ncbi:hypothetical protein BT69DRAFT_1342119 [Atractiella rhizophila]|nr:hypothetical protein BT69DRAFT_1342119 [Atractiella rhizophila]
MTTQVSEALAQHGEGRVAYETVGDVGEDREAVEGVAEGAVGERGEGGSGEEAGGGGAGVRCATGGEGSLSTVEGGKKKGWLEKEQEERVKWQESERLLVKLLRKRRMALEVVEKQVMRPRILPLELGLRQQPQRPGDYCKNFLKLTRKKEINNKHALITPTTVAEGRGQILACVGDLPDGGRGKRASREKEDGGGAEEDVGVRSRLASPKPTLPFLRDALVRGGVAEVRSAVEREAVAARASTARLGLSNLVVAADPALFSHLSPNLKNLLARPHPSNPAAYAHPRSSLPTNSRYYQTSGQHADIKSESVRCTGSGHAEEDMEVKPKTPGRRSDWRSYMGSHLLPAAAEGDANAVGPTSSGARVGVGEGSERWEVCQVGDGCGCVPPHALAPPYASGCPYITRPRRTEGVAS